MGQTACPTLPRNPTSPRCRLCLCLYHSLLQPALGPLSLSSCRLTLPPPVGSLSPPLFSGSLYPHLSALAFSLYHSVTLSPPAGNRLSLSVSLHCLFFLLPGQRAFCSLSLFITLTVSPPTVPLSLSVSPLLPLVQTVLSLSLSLAGSLFQSHSLSLPPLPDTGKGDHVRFDVDLRLKSVNR